MKKSIVTLSILAAFLLVGCKDKQQPVPERDWANTTYVVNTSDEPGQSTYYKPVAGTCGDPMPFYDPEAGIFRVFYEQEFPFNTASYHPIWALETSDCANYTALGEAISSGNEIEPDAALGTGSVIYNADQKVYYFFYTGHAADGNEVVLYATSTDCKQWTKCNTFLLNGAALGYSDKDFRDPEVILSEGVYHMFISTRQDGKGVFAHFTSADCKTWEHKGVWSNMLWNGDAKRFEECPNIFQMGKYWYLIYSDQNVDRTVHYFKGNSLSDLKSAIEGGIFPDGKEGKLDSQSFYAGKTASDGENRYIWGWCQTREGKDNTKPGVWAGNLVCHRVIQHEDGTLVLEEVPAIRAKYNQDKPVRKAEFSLKEGETMLMERMGYHTHLSFSATTGDKEDLFSISLIRGEGDEKHEARTDWYNIILDPRAGGAKHAIKYEKNGKENDKGEPDPEIAGTQSYEFPTPADNTYHVDIYTDNSVFVMYINHTLCYTQRIYGMARNCWSLNCWKGSLEVKDVKHTEY